MIRLKIACAVPGKAAKMCGLGLPCGEAGLTSPHVVQVKADICEKLKFDSKYINLVPNYWYLF